MAADEDFLQPIELLLPHAFHPEDGAESVVMLGARAGSSEWQPLPIGSVKDIGGPDEEGIAHLKVAVTPHLDPDSSPNLDLDLNT